LAPKQTSPIDSNTRTIFFILPPPCIIMFALLRALVYIIRSGLGISAILLGKLQAIPIERVIPRLYEAIHE